jgi:glycosyltransferase involved in cell wall biosynthesis
MRRFFGLTARLPRAKPRGTVRAMADPSRKRQLGLMHRLWRVLPAQQRHAAAAQATRLLAPRPDRAPALAQGSVAVAGELSRPSGLGEGARLMLAAVKLLGLAACPLDFGDPALGGPPGKLAIPPEGVALVVHVNAPWLPLALLRAPRGLLRGRRIIGYWSWELPTMPPSWRVGVDFVHEVWVPSAFTAAAVRTMLPDSMPLQVVPHMAAVAPPRPSGLTRADFGLPDEAVVVLTSFSLASSLARKNPLAAIAAHRMAFGDRPDRILVLKLANAEAHPADLADLRRAVAGAANIRIDSRTLKLADSHALTACADIVLSLHRSEGFGLVPAEAMLLGRAVVATGWSGNMEFMDDGSAALVGARLVPASDPRGVFEAPGAEWAEPDVAEAAAHLRALADDPAAREALGARARRRAGAALGPAVLGGALHRMGLDVPGRAA